MRSNDQFDVLPGKKQAPEIHGSSSAELLKNDHLNDLENDKSKIDYNNLIYLFQNEITVRPSIIRLLKYTANNLVAATIDEVTPLTLSNFVKLTQSSNTGWLRAPTANNRWDTTAENVREFPLEASKIINEIGVLGGYSLSITAYDGAVILGSSIPSLAKRFFHLQDLIRSVKFSNLYLMGSTENFCKYVDSLRDVIRLYPERFTKEIRLPENLTEHSLMKFFVANLIWPDHFQDIKIISLPTEMKKIENDKLIKPTTNDELHTLSTHLEKRNRKCKLAIISHSPFAFRQNLIFQMISSKHDIETTFANYVAYPKLNTLSGIKLNPSLILDELARLFYQLDKFIDNRSERLNDLGIYSNKDRHEVSKSLLITVSSANAFDYCAEYEANSPKRIYPNKILHDLIMPYPNIKTFSIDEVRNQLEPCKEYNYVLTEDRNLIISDKYSVTESSLYIYAFEFLVKHPYLSRDKKVIAAGELSVIRDSTKKEYAVIKSIDNNSGHFQPEFDNSLADLVECAFLENGFNEARGKFQFYKQSEKCCSSVMEISKNLNEVLNSFGYASYSKKISFVKLAAYRGCFDENYKNKIISDKIAHALLLTSFDSLVAGINWWVDILQNKMLRANFFKEGLGKDKDPIINVARWNQKLELPDALEYNELLKLFRILGLVDSVQWPSESASHVVVHGGISKFILDRINFIPAFSGRLYYMTNPRGLFNDELYLANIIASWLENSNYISIIQDVLERNANLKTSNKNWLKDLNGIKQEILSAINKDIWPAGKGWYYKNSEIFNNSSAADSRQSLAGWPTVMDLVEYILQQRAIAESAYFNNIELVPVYSIRPGRVSNTEDNIEDWYINYGQHLTNNTLVVFVSNNSKGLHYISFQDEIMKKVIRKLVSSSKTIRFLTVGPGAEEISLSAASDVIAKIFYTKRPETIKKLSLQEEPTPKQSNIELVVNHKCNQKLAFSVEPQNPPLVSQISHANRRASSWISTAKESASFVANKFINLFYSTPKLASTAEALPSSEQSSEKPEFKRGPVNSTFIQEQQSREDILVAAQWCMHYLNNSLPWNKQKDLTSELRRCLEQQKNSLKLFEQQFTAAKASRSYRYGVNKTLFEDIEYLLNKTKSSIDDVLSSGKMSKFVSSNIASNMTRIETQLPCLIDTKKAHAARHASRKAVLQQKRNKTSSIGCEQTLFGSTNRNNNIGNHPQFLYLDPIIRPTNFTRVPQIGR